MCWTINIQDRTATNSNGLAIRFTQTTADGEFQGIPDQPYPSSLPHNSLALARLMREGSDAFNVEINKA